MTLYPRKDLVLTTVAKHLQGQHDQQEHNYPRSKRSETRKIIEQGRDDEEKGQIQRVLNRWGFENDGDLSNPEKVSLLLAGTVGGGIFLKKNLDVIDMYRVNAGSKKAVGDLDDGFFNRVGRLTPDSYSHLQGRSHKETLGKVEEFLKGTKREFGFVIAHDGEILVATKGNRRMVPFDIDFTEMSMAEKRGMAISRGETAKFTFTHSHPNLPLPLSAPDVQMMAKFEFDEMRAVTSRGVSSLRSTSGAPLSVSDANGISEQYMNSLMKGMAKSGAGQFFVGVQQAPRFQWNIMARELDKFWSGVDIQGFKYTMSSF